MFTKTKILSRTTLGLLLLTMLAIPSHVLATSDTNAYLGTWKGATYSGKGTFADIILTLNADGSYSCSGYPPFVPGETNDSWTPWRVICVTEDGQTNKWEIILPEVLRFTHKNPSLKNAPMSIVQVSTLTNKSLVLDLPAGGSSGSSLVFAEFTKQ
jgi:hypothetical protein